MKGWRFYIVFIPLLMMLIHGFVPHSHASHSTHPVICQENVSLVHKFFDLISVDIGVNHLEDYVLQQTEDVFLSDHAFLLHLNAFLNSAVFTESLLTFSQTQNFFPLKSHLFAGTLSRRGPPFQY